MSAHENDLERLRNVADDHEAAVLDALCLKAGLTWNCYGPGAGESSAHWTNSHDDKACRICGTARAIGELEDYKR